MTFNQNGTPIRYISGGRELRNYQGYWYIRLTQAELKEWPGVHWTGCVLIHKYKWWKQYGEWFGQHEARYKYIDGDQDNIRITNIAIKFHGTDEWL